MWPKISKNHKAPRLRLSDHVVVLFLNSCFSGHVHIRAPMPYPWPTAHCTQLSRWFMSPDFTAKLRMSPRRPLDMTWHDHYDLCTSNEYTALYRSIIQSRYSPPGMSDHAGYFHRTVSQIAKEHNSVMPYDLLTAVKYFQRDTGQLADSPLDCRRRDLFAGFCRFVREEEWYGSQSQFTLTRRSPCAWMIAWIAQRLALVT